MKRLTSLVLLVISVFFPLACWNAGSAIDTDSDSDSETDTDTDTVECEHGDEQCAGDIVQICQDGEWFDWSDCALFESECVIVSEGVAECDWGDNNSEGDWDLLEDFDDYEAGDYIVATAGDPWDAWSTPALPGEDTQVSNANSWSGYNSLHVIENNHVVVDMNKNSGHWAIEFEIFVEDDRMGYYNLQQVFTGDASGVCGVEMYFYSGGVGNCVIGGKQNPFMFEESTWVTVSHDIDIDADVAYITVEGKDVYAWSWSTAQGSPPASIDAVVFYGLPEQPGTEYFIDDFRYRWR